MTFSKMAMRGIRQHCPTYSEGKHVWQGSRSVIDDVKLARLQEQVPIGSLSTKRLSNAIPKCEDREGIIQTKDGSDYQSA